MIGQKKNEKKISQLFLFFILNKREQYAGIKSKTLLFYCIYFFIYELFMSYIYIYIYITFYMIKQFTKSMLRENHSYCV